MTNETQHKLRRFFGWAAMFGAVSMTALTGYRAHMNTLKETERLADRQDILYLSIDSEGQYPMCVIDSSGHVVQWNLGMELLTGLSQEEAERDGIRSLMCDPVKMKQHDSGLFKAFQEGKNDSILKIVHCDITNPKTKQSIPVQISIRMREARNKLYAVARVDKDSNIQEFGKPSAERAVSK